MKDLLKQISLKVTRTYEQRVDEVVGILSHRSFPAQFFFLKDGIALGTITRYGNRFIAPPGTKAEGVINADYPRALELLQPVLKQTQIGYVPKGVIRDAVREAWRRRFNALQMEKIQADLDAAKDGRHAPDNPQTAALIDQVFRGLK